MNFVIVPVYFFLGLDQSWSRKAFKPMGNHLLEIPSSNLLLASTRRVHKLLSIVCTAHSESRALLSINLSNIKKIQKNHGNTENLTRGRWRRNKIAIHCAMPLPQLKF